MRQPKHLVLQYDVCVLLWGTKLLDLLGPFYPSRDG